MSTVRVPLRRIFVDDLVADHPLTQEILARLKGLPVEVLPPRAKPPVPLVPLAEVLRWGKETLFLTRFPGRFFRPCPGTKAYTCCGYRIFHIGQGCPLNCTYCILQAYFNEPWLSFFVNILEEGLGELEAAIAALSPGKVLRIGTGEFTDSLALDPVTALNRHLVSFFAAQDRAVLELKTKTRVIDFLEGLSHRRRIIVSWSLNTERVAASEERGAPTVAERLEAAKQVVSWGYPVGFHFDPIIYYPGWEEEYPEIIERLFAAIPAEEIVWISLGSLRYMPVLKEIALERFPETKIFSEEFIVGLDGKKRYFRDLRVKLYRTLYQAIRAHSREVCVYLCMESPEVWEESLGFAPRERGGLPRMLDAAAVRVCKLSP